MVLSAIATYTVARAAVGDIRAARVAGYAPANAPTSHPHPELNMGNVSHDVPTIHPRLAVGSPGHDHTPAFTAASASAPGQLVVRDGGVAMAWTIIDLATDGGTGDLPIGPPRAGHN